jgi:cytochrome c oxidase cbb3-type subunit III
MNAFTPLMMLGQISQQGFSSDPFNHPMLPVYIVGVFVFVVLILVLVVSGILLRAIHIIIEDAERKKANELGITYVPKPGWWTKVSQKLNASIPVEDEQSIELEHNYDGIRELDNHLPPWWKWLFYGTIAWSVVYLILFHLSSILPLSADEYQGEIARAEQEIRLYRSLQPQAQIDESSLQYNPDEKIISKGKSVFADNNCGSCHRNDGGGNTIGPNLTDEYWLHGGDIQKVFSTIKNGIVEKGMPAWGKSLSPTQVRDVSFFILSLQGSKPVNAKAPQGDLFKSTNITSDSSRVSVAF